MTILALIVTICSCINQPAGAPMSRTQTTLDAATSIQQEIDRQIDASQPSIKSSPVIRLPKGRFILKHPISMRGTWGGAIAGQGYGTVLVADFDEKDRGKPMIDLTGCSRFRISDLKIMGGTRTNPGNRSTPGAGILLARKAGESAGFHVIERVYFEGRFAIAGLANVASEVNVFRDCVFTNEQGPSSWTEDRLPVGGYCVLISNGNYRDLLDVSVGTSSMLELSFDNCSFHLNCADLSGAQTEGGAAIMIAGAETLSCGDIFFTGGGGYIQQSKAAVLLHAVGSTGLLERIVFEKMRWEIETCEYGLLGVSTLPRVIGPVMWRDCSVFVARQFARFTDMATGFGVERTHIVRKSGRLPDFAGPAIEANRSIGWDVRLPLGSHGWPRLVDIHQSACNDLFLAPSKQHVRLPETNVSDVKVETSGYRR